MRPTVKLGELGTFIRGVSYKKGDLLPKRENGCISLLRSNNIQAELDLSELQYLNKNSVKNEQITQKGDILFCMSNGSPHLVGKNVLLPELENYSFGAFCSIFRKTNESALSEYIAKYLQSGNYTSFITSLSRGAGINNLRGSDLENIEIPLPPLETQKAIVAKLDQIFAELDQTKSEIQKNLDNTDELWKSALNQAFQGDWEMKKLGEIAEIGPKKAEISLDENTKVSFVPMSDLSQEEMLFQTKNENTISELRKGSYTYFKNNDVLLAKVTPCFENGKCGIAKNLTNGIGFGSSEFIVFRPKDFIKSEFLYYFVSNKAFREEGAKNMGGAVGLQRVKKDWIENHNIPVPPLSEQEKIVEHLDQVSKEVKALKSQYQSQLDNLEELKNSVLDKAFRGELGE